MPELDDVVVCTTNAGDHLSLALTGDWSTDISEAVTEEHGGCEGGSCDICEAADNGYPLSAAFLLQGATETPVISAVAEAYERAGIDPPEGESLGQGWPKAEWDEWCAYHDTWARKCHACGSYTFANANWEPETCSNCNADLFEHFAIAVVYHVKTNRGATAAYEEFDADDAEALFSTNPLVFASAKEYEDPSFEVVVKSQRGRWMVEMDQANEEEG